MARLRSTRMGLVIAGSIYFTKEERPMECRGNGGIFIAAAAVAWSTGGLFIKLISGWNSLAINGVTGAIAVLVMMACMRKTKLKLTKAVVFTGLNAALTSVLFVMANRYTTAANAIALHYTNPMFVVLFTALLQRKWPNKAQAGLSIMIFAGILLSFADQMGGGGWWGNLLALLSGVTFACVFIGNQMPGASPKDASIFGYGCNAVIGLPLAFFQPAPAGLSWVGLIGMGLELGLAYTCFSIGIKRTSAVTASLISVLELVCNPFWVFLFLGERPSLFTLLGCGIILLGIVLNVVLENRQPAEQEEGRVPLAAK